MPLDDMAARIAIKEAELRAACQERAAWLSFDGSRVREGTAAAILDISEGHLANLRSEGRAPNSYRVGGRVTYALVDLAAIIVQAKK